MNDSPADFGLPESHGAWRPYQLENIHWCESLSGYGFLSAPTGSGKSAVPTALSTSRFVTALCQTKSLQQENYQGLYGFDVLTGRSNWNCIHPKGRGRTAAECLFRRPSKCPEYSSCPYHVRKRLVQSSSRRSLNYAYYLAALWPKQVKTAALFLDEGHLVPDVVLDRAGCTVHERQRQQWRLPKFPTIRSSERPMFGDDPLNVAGKWLVGACTKLRAREQTLETKADDSLDDAKRLTRCQRLLRDLSDCRAALERCKEGWFIRSGPGVGMYRRESMPGIVLRPLTARYHFRSYFGAKATILMSATIGEPAALATELGIKEYTSRDVPNQWPAERRPVYALDVPRLNRNSTRRDYDRQADAITQAIEACPADWSGIIHVTRIKEATILAQRLAGRGLQNRVWVPPHTVRDRSIGTDGRAILWKQRRDAVPGSLWIAWDAHTGMNAEIERIDICAKVRFANIGDPFERERMVYSRAYYELRAAQETEQSLGRTRRGRECDYDVLGERRGCVCIADGAWRRIRKRFSKDLLEAIIEGPVPT